MTGRWLTRDPIGELGGLNLYTFALNRAVSLIDAVGLDSVWASTRYSREYTIKGKYADRAIDLYFGWGAEVKIGGEVHKRADNVLYFAFGEKGASPGADRPGRQITRNNAALLDSHFVYGYIKAGSAKLSSAIEDSQETPTGDYCIEFVVLTQEFKWDGKGAGDEFEAWTDRTGNYYGFQVGPFTVYGDALEWAPLVGPIITVPYELFVPKEKFDKQKNRHDNDRPGCRWAIVWTCCQLAGRAIHSLEAWRLGWRAPHSPRAQTHQSGSFSAGKQWFAH